MTKRGGRNLSERLRMIAGMVTPGGRVVDIGCDHGFLPVWLVREGISPGAVAMDVREGPLEAAKRHIGESGLGDYIEARLSDGLAEYRAGEADSLVCAGLGGRLMEKILQDGLDKAKGFRELVLQPQSEIPQFRAFLRAAGFVVLEEDACLEEGKFYFAMRAVPECAGGGAAERAPGPGAAVLAGETSAADETGRLADLFGGRLLARRHPVLWQYLRQRERYLVELGGSLAAAGSEQGRIRAEEVREELAAVRAALSLYL